MRILITGHDGYIGSVMVPVLRAAGHEVVGMDAYFFSNYRYQTRSTGILEGQQDIRDIAPEEFEGYDAVVHLAALSNDPLSELNPELTFEINHKASVKLAELAKRAGVQRFLYASTCSVYGVANQDELATEDTSMRPLTPYAISKVRVEDDLSQLADDTFSPVYLRNATAYGWSPNYRSDLVVNNLSAWAYTTGEIRIMSDGTPWRPIIHVQDIANAFAAVLNAPREVIHNQAFNVGINSENYQVRDIAAIVQEGFAGCKVTYNEHGSPDPRSYRVDFSKIARTLPEFNPTWNVRLGVDKLSDAYQQTGLTYKEFTGAKYVRLARLNALIREGRLDSNLYWKDKVTHTKA